MTTILPLPCWIFITGNSIILPLPCDFGLTIKVSLFLKELTILSLMSFVFCPSLNDHLYVREFGDSSMPPSSAIKRRQSPDWCHSLTELGAKQILTKRLSDQEQGLSDLCSDARLSARMRPGDPESLRVAGAGAAQDPGHLRQEHAGRHDVQCGRCWWVVTWWHDDMNMMTWCTM